MKRRVGTDWEYSSNLTSVYLDILHEIATAGTTSKDKNALLTGVGKGSIGVEVVKGLLSGGTHVVITTSRYNRSTVDYYQSISPRHLEVADLLLPSYLSTKARSRMWKLLLTTSTPLSEWISTSFFPLPEFLRMAEV